MNPSVSAPCDGDCDVVADNQTDAAAEVCDMRAKQGLSAREQAVLAREMAVADREERCGKLERSTRAQHASIVAWMMEQRANAAQQQRDAEAALQHTRQQQQDAEAALQHAQQQQQDAEAALQLTQQQQQDMNATLQRTQQELKSTQVTLECAQQQHATVMAETRERVTTAKRALQAIAAKYDNQKRWAKVIAPLTEAEMLGPAVPFLLHDGTTYLLSRAFVERVGGSLAALAREAIHRGENNTEHLVADVGEGVHVERRGLGAALALDAEAFRQWARWEQGFVAPHALTPQLCFAIDAMAELLQVPPRATQAYAAHTEQEQKKRAQEKRARAQATRASSKPAARTRAVFDRSHAVLTMQARMDNARARAYIYVEDARRETRRLALCMEASIRALIKDHAGEGEMRTGEYAAEAYIETAYAALDRLKARFSENRNYLCEIAGLTQQSRQTTLRGELEDVTSGKMSEHLFSSRTTSPMRFAWPHVVALLRAQLAEEDACDELEKVGIKELAEMQTKDAYRHMQAGVGAGAGAGADAGAGAGAGTGVGADVE